MGHGAWISLVEGDEERHWQRAHVVWCLSSENRLECFVIVIKTWQDFNSLTFPFWQTPNGICTVSICPVVPKSTLLQLCKPKTCELSV